MLRGRGPTGTALGGTVYGFLWSLRMAAWGFMDSFDAYQLAVFLRGSGGQRRNIYGV